MHKARILIVEDDKRLAALLEQELTFDNHTTRCVHSGTEALLFAQDEPYDLVILDLNLPDIDGVEVAERLRDRVDASILMLTARGDVASRVGGLYAGASDYLTKPFSLDELRARIHVRLRDRQAAPVIQHKGVELDSAQRRCRVNNTALELTGHEFSLLERLLMQPGRIYTKDELERHLYGADASPGSNTVEVFVSSLRKKLAAQGVNDLIQTVRGRGYVIQ